MNVLSHCQTLLVVRQELEFEEPSEIFVGVSLFPCIQKWLAQLMVSSPVPTGILDYSSLTTLVPAT